MKHIKEFNSFEPINEVWTWFLGATAAFFFYKFMKELIKTMKRNYPGVVANVLASKDMIKYKQMTPQQREKFEEELKKRGEDTRFKILLSYLKDFFEKGGKVKFSENILYYIFELDDLTIKINKENRNITWNELSLDRSQKISEWIVQDKEKFIKPMPISKEDMEYLINSIKEEK